MRGSACGVPEHVEDHLLRPAGFQGGSSPVRPPDPRRGGSRWLMSAIVGQSVAPDVAGTRRTRPGGQGSRAVTAPARQRHRGFGRSRRCHTTTSRAVRALVGRARSAERLSRYASFLPASIDRVPKGPVPAGDDGRNDLSRAALGAEERSAGIRWRPENARGARWVPGPVYRTSLPSTPPRTRHDAVDGFLAMLAAARAAIGLRKPAARFLRGIHEGPRLCRCHSRELPDRVGRAWIAAARRTSSVPTPTMETFGTVCDFPQALQRGCEIFKFHVVLNRFVVDLFPFIRVAGGLGGCRSSPFLGKRGLPTASPWARRETRRTPFSTIPIPSDVLASSELRQTYLGCRSQVEGGGSSAPEARPLPGIIVIFA